MKESRTDISSIYKIIWLKISTEQHYNVSVYFWPGLIIKQIKETFSNFEYVHCKYRKKLKRRKDRQEKLNWRTLFNVANTMHYQEWKPLLRVLIMMFETSKRRITLLSLIFHVKGLKKQLTIRSLKIQFVFLILKPFFPLI